MKFIKSILSFTIAAILLVSCDGKDHYVDLNTGKTIIVEKDSATGYMINTETKEPVTLYVNTTTHDTIYGKTGKVVNNLVVKSGDGRYTYQANGDVKMTDNDGDKIKMEADGDYKIKDGDYKKKVEKDGDIKIKDGDTKIKIKDGEKKVKKD
jgi:hypothetical protein